MNYEDFEKSIIIAEELQHVRDRLDRTSRYLDSLLMELKHSVVPSRIEQLKEKIRFVKFDIEALEETILCLSRPLEYHQNRVKKGPADGGSSAG